MGIESVRNPWHVVNGIKDMPKRTCEIIIKSDTGYNYVANWNAHKRHLYVQAIRSHWDNVFSCRVLDGKVDGYRVKFSGNDLGMCVAWCPMPMDNDDWE